MVKCSRCGHETAGRRKVRPDLCGPCLVGKPVGWWDDLPAVLAKLGMPAALLAWGLAGGGGGCSGVPSPVPVAFGCAQFPNTIHVAYAFGPGTESEQIEPAFTIQDCEWNGIDDSGPLDSDSLDPQGDPRANWDYAIQADGRFMNLQQAWSTVSGQTLQVHTIAELTIPVTAGQRYTLTATSGVNYGYAATQAHVRCPGDVQRDWDLATSEALQWTAVESGVCNVQAVSACFQTGAPANSFAECGDTFSVVRG